MPPGAVGFEEVSKHEYIGFAHIPACDDATPNFAIVPYRGVTPSFLQAWTAAKLILLQLQRSYRGPQSCPGQLHGLPKIALDWDLGGIPCGCAGRAARARTECAKARPMQARGVRFNSPIHRYKPEMVSPLVAWSHTTDRTSFFLFAHISIISISPPPRLTGAEKQWGQVDLPQHPTSRQSKRCAKAAPYGMDNAVSVRSRVELSATVDRSAFCASRRAPLIRRSAPPSPRCAGEKGDIEASRERFVRQISAAGDAFGLCALRS